MKKFFNFALAVLVVVILVGLVLGFGSWLASELINIALVQMGLGKINAWGVINLTLGLQLIYRFVRWVTS